MDKPSICNKLNIFLLRHTLLLDIFLVIVLFLLLFIFIGEDIWLLHKFPLAEAGRYEEVSKHISKLYNSFSFSLEKFTFQLAPTTLETCYNEFIRCAEKPLFTAVLGYFTLLFQGITPDIFHVSGFFNLLLLNLIGVLVIRIFRKVGSLTTGFIVTSFLFININMLSVSLSGYHTILGISLALLILLFIITKNFLLSPSKKLYYLVGLGCGLLFFTSPHLISISLAFLAFTFFIIGISQNSKPIKIKLAIFLIFGVATPICYFVLRDIWFFSQFSINEKATYSTIKMLFLATEEASKQNLPRFDLSFIYDLLKMTEGIPLILFLITGITLGFISFISALKNRLIQKLDKLFILLACTIVLSLFLLISIPLPYINRAYLPIIVFGIMLSASGFLLFIKQYKYKKVTYVIMLAIFSAGLFKYQKSIKSTSHTPSPKYSATVVQTIDKKLKTPSNITTRLNELQKEGIKYISISPVPFAHHEISFPDVYCYFINLMDKTPQVKKLETYSVENPFLNQNLFTNEHYFYRLVRQKATHDYPFLLVDLKIAKEFNGPFSFHIYDLNVVLNAVRKLDSTDLTCEALKL